MQRPLTRFSRVLASSSSAPAVSVLPPARHHLSTSRPTPSPAAPTPSSSSAPPAHAAGASGTKLYYPASTQIVQHLEGLLSPIGCALDEGRAVRSVTHKSAAGNKGASGSQAEEGQTGSGEKMAFVGRRVLRLHLSLSLSSTLSHTPALLSQYLSQDSLDALLETKELGAGGSVGKAWGLENVMRWREVRAQNGEPSGLFKSRGAAVESIIGAVYFQHGIAATSKLFSSLVLPSLSLPSALANALDSARQDGRVPVQDRALPTEETRV